LFGGTNGRLFAGTCHLAYGPSLRVSQDGGETWRQLPHSPRYERERGRCVQRIWQLAEGPNGTLYAGVDEAGLFSSGDGGETWRELEGMTRHPSAPGWTPCASGIPVHSLVPHPTDARKLWVAISDGGVFRTADGGESWTACANGLPARSGDPEGMRRGVHRLAADPFAPETLYVQHIEGVFRSTDGGESWLPLNRGLTELFGFPLAVTAGGDLYIAPLDRETRCFPEGRLRLYRLRHGEAEWEPVGRGLPETPHYVGVLRDALAADSRSPAGIYFGTTQGDVFCSADGGENWYRLPGQFSRVTTVSTSVQDAPQAANEADQLGATDDRSRARIGDAV
jgi:photosystem II stability/assembly factor-like uncharacterized protein